MIEITDFDHLIDKGEAPPHWVWKGTTNYGKPWGAPRFDGEYVRTALWVAFRDEPLPDGTPVKAGCGVAICVRPEHLTMAPQQRRRGGTKGSEAATTIELLDRIELKLDQIIQHLGIDPFHEN